MTNIILISGLAAAYLVLLSWACRTLPGEKWQVLATMPKAKNMGGSWDGVNLTYYGFFSATAYAAAAALMVMMLGALGVAPVQTLSLAAPLLLVCIPASSLVARVVEKKPATFTIGGASFVGLIIAPWITLLIGVLTGERSGGLQVAPVMAALAVAYAFGEGLGRLACISFGCCYGKPLDQCSALTQSVFRGRVFIFRGAMKKAAYEGGLEGRPLLPVQAMSSLVCVGASLGGLWLFLSGFFAAALWLVLLVTQSWRAYSETLRRDYRGGGRMSAYQVMALAGIVYGGLAVMVFPVSPLPIPKASAGLGALWSAGVLICLESLWLFILMYMGRSKVTGATISFYLNQNQI